MFETLCSTLCTLAEDTAAGGDGGSLGSIHNTLQMNAVDAVVSIMKGLMNAGAHVHMMTFGTGNAVQDNRMRHASMAGGQGGWEMDDREDDGEDAGEGKGDGGGGGNGEAGAGVGGSGGSGGVDGAGGAGAMSSPTAFRSAVPSTALSVEIEEARHEGNEGDRPSSTTDGGGTGGMKGTPPAVRSSAFSGSGIVSGLSSASSASSSSSPASESSSVPGSPNEGGGQDVSFGEDSAKGGGGGDGAVREEGAESEVKVRVGFAVGVKEERKETDSARARRSRRGVLSRKSSVRFRYESQQKNKKYLEKSLQLAKEKGLRKALQVRRRRARSTRVGRKRERGRERERGKEGKREREKERMGVSNACMRTTCSVACTNQAKNDERQTTILCADLVLPCAPLCSFVL